MRWMAVGIVLVSIACALVAHRIAEDDFPTVGIAFWWAVQTVTTVGYGDVTPTTRNGQIIGTILMIAGVAAVTLLTAAISAAWVARMQKRWRGDPDDPVLEALDRLERRLDELDGPRDR
jgi:hypothetical protein